jgi:hypothetical protein
MDVLDVYCTFDCEYHSVIIVFVELTIVGYVLSKQLKDAVLEAHWVYQ